MLNPVNQYFIVTYFTDITMWVISCFLHQLSDKWCQLPCQQTPCGGLILQLSPIYNAVLLSLPTELSETQVTLTTNVEAKWNNNTQVIIACQGCMCVHRKQPIYSKYLCQAIVEPIPSRCLAKKWTYLFFRMFFQMPPLDLLYLNIDKSWSTMISHKANKKEKF